MKKILLLLPILLLMFAGCSDDNDSNGGGTSQETLNKVDNAFTSEFEKYVLNDDNSSYTGEFSDNAVNNIKSILQNITGRSGMPAASGIGVVSDEEVATSISKIIAGKKISAPILYYSALDKTSNEFTASVMEVFMNDDGMTLITELKHINSNSLSIVSLADSLQTSLEEVNPSENARANMIYLASSLISYLKDNAQSGISGIKEEYVLPDNKAMLDDIAQAFMAQGEYVSNYKNWDKSTPTFTVMPLLTNGQSMMIMGDDGKMTVNQAAIGTMMAFMKKLTDIFVKYGYAETSASSEN